MRTTGRPITDLNYLNMTVIGRPVVRTQGPPRHQEYHKTFGSHDMITTVYGEGRCTMTSLRTTCASKGIGQVSHNGRCFVLDDPPFQHENTCDHEGRIKWKPLCRAVLCGTYTGIGVHWRWLRSANLRPEYSGPTVGNLNIQVQITPGLEKRKRNQKKYFKK